MRVLFFISVLGHGRGGHFHSLNHISVAIAEKVNVGIYSIGTYKSDIIKKNQWFLGHTYFDGKNLFSFRKEIRQNIKNFQPDIIHCFDVTSYNILTLVTKISRNKIVVNKCGGPNPIAFPFVQNLILFSVENQKWFNDHNKFKSSSIFVIPNRVNKNELVGNKKEFYLKKEKAFCFVRITRIGVTYKKSIEVSINLISELLKAQAKNVHLYIIGTIEDLSVFKDLKEKGKGLPITFLTKDLFTKKASDMLYLADAVIATGRGVMEATALSKPILTPVKNASIPVLVNRCNFESFLTTNFSQRNVCNEIDHVKNFNSIYSMVCNSDFRDELKKLSIELFHEYFDIRSGISKYMQVYETMLNRTVPPKRNFINLKYQLKSLFLFLKNGK